MVINSVQWHFADHMLYIITLNFVFHP